jgi:hypothetical protein
MAKRYNHRALSEAIKQGQARMKQTMSESRSKTEVKPSEPPLRRLPEREPSPVGFRPYSAERSKPLAINQGVIVIAGVLIGIFAVLFLIGRGKEKPAISEQPQGAPVLQVPPQETPAPKPTPVKPEPVQPKPAVQPKPKETVKPAAPAPAAPVAPAAEAKPPQETKTGLEKDHVIVIATYTKREHLLPAQAYFDTNGIKTEILRRGSYYLLVTSERFDSPLKAGSDGQKMLEKIQAVGAKYKAPDGYENFGRTPFQDAYGMKVKN